MVATVLNLLFVLFVKRLVQMNVAGFQMGDCSINDMSITNVNSKGVDRFLNYSKRTDKEVFCGHTFCCLIEF